MQKLKSMRKSKLIGLRKKSGDSMVAELVSQNENAVIVVNPRYNNGPLENGTYYIDKEEIEAQFILWEKK